jgi:hypothetical protein
MGLLCLEVDELKEGPKNLTSEHYNLYYHQYHCDNRIKNGVGRSCSMHGKRKIVLRIKLCTNTLTIGPNRRWEDDIKEEPT